MGVVNIIKNIIKLFYKREQDSNFHLKPRKIWVIVIFCGREICAICHINAVNLRNSTIANFLVENKVKIRWTWTGDPSSQQIDPISSCRPTCNQNVTVT